MKKLFLLLALAGVMVACGDEKKKDEKKDAQTTEAPATVEENDVPEAPEVGECCGKCEQECNKECGDVCTGECGEECCEEMCCGECDEEIPAIMSDVVIPVASGVDALINKAMTAIMNNDEAGFNALEAEYNKLSAEDQAKFEAAVMAAMGM